MNKKNVFAGQLNTPVEFFKNISTANEAGEAVMVPVSLGVKFSKRVDISGSEDLDGRLVSLSVCKYVLRYDQNFLENGTAFFLLDVDGVFDVNSVTIFGQKRNKFIELKCSKRGE